jgi:uncharacterized protein
VIDACTHPVVARPADINAYIARPYRAARFAQPAYGPYPMAADGYVSGSRPADGGLPGSDPVLFEEQVLHGPGADYAILLPLGRGLLGDVAYSAALDAATNAWLAEAWLSEEINAHGRYKGSIRVTPRAPAEAVKEIERWASHPHMVQVTVPLEALTPYGQPEYFPVWEAAASAGLPVAIHSDHNVGFAKSTAVSQPGSYFEQYAQTALYSMTHVDSFIAFGVLDRLAGLQLVLADGGFDYFQALMWRVDKDWRGAASEVPLISRAPSEYMFDRVRVVVGASDGGENPDEFRRFIELNAGLAEILMYGSNYPSWDHLGAAELQAGLPPDQLEAIMDATARELYRLAADD